MDEITFQLSWEKVETIHEVAAQVMAQLDDLRVITFTGDLGAGKTTLIKAICSFLGFQGNVASPTYPVIAVYGLNDGSEIVHMDCYRLKSESEAEQIGIPDYVDSGSYCFIEWPGVIENLLPLKYASIEITTTSATGRKLTLIKHLYE
jgi:tRNA threonylcarbamoyladenosine biosynthesis protein TsaE